MLVLDCGSAKEYLTALPHVADDTRLGADGGVVGDGQMSYDSHLACEDAVLSDLCRAGNAALRCHDGVVADLDIVRNLAEIVYLDSVTDDCGLHFGAVYGSVCSDFNIVSYDDVAEVLDFFPCAIRLGGVAESVGSDHAVRVEDAPVTYHHSGIDPHTGVYYAILADGGVFSDIDIFANLAEVSDDAFPADMGEISDIDFLADFCVECD